ncbi:hypothetical protein [Catellatospora sp. NPDC049609]|uniref:hypothetical protein n=1 Tax=Catellatospora sp. NPDC049609 TaxID=3155505 RepID=UPI0034391AF5
MSETYLSVIPTDATWQPALEAGHAADRVFARMVPDTEELDAKWHERIQLVEAGSNLAEIRCPSCAGQVDMDWWDDLVDAAYEDEEEGWTGLDVAVPCCGVVVSLNDLRYDWPTGFARFELSARSPDRGWLTEEELAELAETLGHPVRQIMARI